MSGEFCAFEFEGRTYRAWMPWTHQVEGAILYLHGRGESGDEHETMTRHGLGKAIREDPARWPFAVVMPQKPSYDKLWPEYTQMIDGILADFETRIDGIGPGRIVTGLSQGGNGAIVLAASLRWKFAAAVPICGWADPRQASRALAGIPTWLFHGTADESVPCSCSVAVHEWLVKSGEDSRLTLYEGVGHNSWDAAYGDADLPVWMLDRCRTNW